MQSFSGKMSRLLAICIALPGLLPLTAVPQAYGTPNKPSFDQRYSSAANRSVEDVDAVLAEAGKKRQVINDQYIDDQRACYHRFFVSSCLEDAKERNRIALKQVREAEVTARVHKRQIMADDHDKALAGQQKTATVASPPKIQERETKQQRLSNREHQSEGQAGSRAKAHQARLLRKQADEAAQAPQRAVNEQAYQKKVQQAKAHRKKIEARKAEKMYRHATPAAAAQNK
jgi:colicin import membrane protein